MEVRRALYCPLCGRAYEDTGKPTRCERCGSPLVVGYDAPTSTIRRLLWESRLRFERGVWSFFPLLPTRQPGLSLGEAWTPILRADRLGERLGVRRFFLKNEACNPTGCFIDRGSAVELERAVEAGARSVVAAGLGDLVSSVAAYSAAYGVQASVYTKRGVEASKLYSIVLRGASPTLSQSVEKAMERASRVADAKAVHLILPYSPGLLEGYRTLVYEIVSYGLTPDALLVPVGDGLLALSICKALSELEDVVKDLPRVIGVRVEGGGSEVGLSELVVERPLALDVVRRLVAKRGGAIIEVKPSRVYRALGVLASTTGIVADPAGAASVAAAWQLAEEGSIDRGESVIALVTGGGSRDPLLLLEAVRAWPEASKALMSLDESVPVLSKAKRRILEILAEKGTMHTYAIWKQLLSEGIKLSLATVHQHVKSLEAEGLITQVGREGKRILYALTTRGYEVLRQSQ